MIFYKRSTVLFLPLNQDDESIIKSVVSYSKIYPESQVSLNDIKNELKNIPFLPALDFVSKILGYFDLFRYTQKNNEYLYFTSPLLQRYIIEKFEIEKDLKSKIIFEFNIDPGILIFNPQQLIILEKFIYKYCKRELNINDEQNITEHFTSLVKAALIINDLFQNVNNNEDLTDEDLQKVLITQQLFTLPRAEDYLSSVLRAKSLFKSFNTSDNNKAIINFELAFKNQTGVSIDEWLNTGFIIYAYIIENFVSGSKAFNKLPISYLPINFTRKKEFKKILKQITIKKSRIFKLIDNNYKKGSFNFMNDFGILKEFPILNYKNIELNINDIQYFKDAFSVEGIYWRSFMYVVENASKKEI